MNPLTPRGIATAALLAWLGCANAAADKEPNNSCGAAQSVGSLEDGAVTGTIAAGDVDFFKVKSAIPGSKLIAKLSGQDNGSGKGVLEETLLGIFDSACNLIGANFNPPDSPVVFDVPADGRYVMAATSCCDDQFQGEGSYKGDYVATVAPYTPTPVISGTVYSADGLPLSDTAVAAYPCPSAAYELCPSPAQFAYTDSGGRYSMPTDYLSQGYAYQIGAIEQPSGNVTRLPPFVLGSQNITADIQLKRASVTLSGISWGSDTIAEDSVAQVKVTVLNNTDKDMPIDAWLTVNALTGSEANSSTFETGQSGTSLPVSVTLPPLKSKELKLAFKVPASALSGSSGYLQIFVSVHGKPLSTYAIAGSLTYTVVPGGQTQLKFGAEAQQQLLQQRTRERLMQMPPRENGN